MGDSSALTSLLFSATMSALLICVMQMQKTFFISSQLHTMFGGYVGSVLFTLMLTAVGNGEFVLFGPRFQSKLFPEVSICLLLAMISCSMVHRVCTTACFLFSMLSLYSINKICKQVNPAPVNVATVTVKKKK